MDRRRDPLLQCYQRCEPTIFKMWMKSKFVLRQPGYYNLLIEKKGETIHLFEVLIFLKTYCYCQSQEIFFKHHLWWYTFGKFYIAKFNYFSGRPYKVKEMFWNIFYWPLCWWIKISLVSIKKILCQCHSP